jgi:hypothetical protein
MLADRRKKIQELGYDSVVMQDQLARKNEKPEARNVRS